ncbi:Lrp/AsnC family transcriptional regulator [Kordiimonas aquimaris]|uniref:Lrp/AsnC family transcriptional regulator n=1 Tax=Kordiimonas aquimaris TaxID=707591 RepID=UPI0021D2BCF0|nr:Lrp/AsnC family transcriptional regulator [Kordiimonas aquimaris]
MLEKLDKQDQRILEVLQNNCRISTQELATQANVSTATCWRRLRALEESGIIDSYRAVLNREKMGYNVCAFVHISIERQRYKIVEEIEQEIIAHPGVLECYTATGDADLVLRVVAADINDFDHFLQGFLFKLKGVSRVRSSITLREIKQTTEIPVDQIARS